MKIVADENIPQVEELFSELGEVSLVSGRNLKAEQLQDADILLVRSVTQVNEELLESSKVKFVGTATIGIDHLNVKYLSGRGIGWANAPGSNANSVVEYVFCAISYFTGRLEALFSGATVGIIGMGNVGSSLYRRLKALGIKCCGYDPLIPQNTFPGMVNIDQVLKADVICCHAPLTTDGDYPTFHLLDYKELTQLKSNALLINAGRGEVINGDALKKVLTERNDLSVVLDVWEFEPGIDLQLLSLTSLATPHIAGYSYDGKIAGTHAIYVACCEFLGIDGNPKTDATTANDFYPLELGNSNSVEAGIGEAVTAAYSISDDDKTLRQALEGCTQERVAVVFDQLRKTYPVRREFSCHTISNSQLLTPQLQHCLSIMGFNINDKPNI